MSEHPDRAVLYNYVPVHAWENLDIRTLIMESFFRTVQSKFSGVKDEDIFVEAHEVDEGIMMVVASWEARDEDFPVIDSWERLN